MRRPSAADLMLLATVTLWALNFTVTKYVISHGLQPLAYSSLRFGTAALVFTGLTYGRERSFRLSRRDLVLLAGAAVVGIFLNQLAFVYAIKQTSAATVALIFGTLPILTALFSFAIGLERLASRFWLGAAFSFAGVALVAAGSGGGVSGNLGGDLLAFAAAATWAAYTVAVAPLTARYSAIRLSAVAYCAASVLLIAAGSSQLASQDYHFPARIWLAYGFAVIGPLVLANALWFTAIRRVGPSRASLFANLQPFLAALFALVILSESITAVQVVGGLAIAAGILAARPARRDRAAARAVAVSSD